MRYEVVSSWAGDEQRVHFVWDTKEKRIVSQIFRDDYRAATEECSRMNSKEGSGKC